MQWNINADALESADRHFADTMALPDLTGLTEVLIQNPKSSQLTAAEVRSKEIYAEMIREVQDLIREIRFGTGTALMLLVDGARAQKEPSSQSSQSVPGLFITEGEMAALLTNDNFYPPSILATDRHRHIGDGQTLGTWFGGLLLDTALLKCHGLLDRLTVALWCHGQLPIFETKAGELKYPSFNREGIKGLKDCYGEDPLWPKFAALIDSSLAKQLVRYRHVGTHKRRIGSALNGGLERWHADENNVSSPTHKLSQGMSVIDHANAPLATYRELLLPALTMATKMIQRHSTTCEHREH